MIEANNWTGDSLKKIFVQTGALLEGHFQLSSGLHSDRYMQCALLFSHPDLAEELGKALAQKVSRKPDFVLSPALGGIVIGQEIARALKTRAYFAERENSALTLRRGFSLKAGQTVVVVEDVITTGKSTKEVIDLSRRAGAQVLQALSIVDRSGSSGPNLGVPHESLLRMDLKTYQAEECPLCLAKKPLVKPGSRPQKSLC